MNRLTIIGNCTKDPELRTTPAKKSVCNFTIAVNRRKKVEGQQQETDYFRVTTWDGLAENCAKYLTKGKKVAVIGSVSVHVFSTQDGKPGATMEVNANEVEFLSSRQDQQNGYTKVDEVEDFPY